MFKTFFISDTHFFHSNILLYERPQFARIDEMNETIIKNWNRVVRKNDVVYHLGDVALTGKDLQKMTIQRLNGRKRLILGNHDSNSVTRWIDVGFEEVSRLPVLHGQFILSHQPVVAPVPYYNIHGHLHSKTVETQPSRWFNVSVEQIDYTPIELNSIKSYFGVLEESEEKNEKKLEISK